MSYQRMPIEPQACSTHRVYEVSKVRLDLFGHISHVLWREIDSQSEREVASAAEAPIASVLAAIHSGAHVFANFESREPRLHDRQFVIVEHSDSSESVSLESPSEPGRQLVDMQRLE